LNTNKILVKNRIYPIFKYFIFPNYYDGMKIIEMYQEFNKYYREFYVETTRNYVGKKIPISRLEFSNHIKSKILPLFGITYVNKEKRLN
jgi:hypothetical protein